MFHRAVALIRKPKPWFWGFVLTAVGIVITLIFQVLAARTIGPEDFAKFASFLAIVNIGAIGAGALQNSVAIRVASSSGLMEVEQHWFSKHSTLIESSILGIGALSLILAFSPLLNEINGSSEATLIAASISFPLSFWFSRNLGVLQGNDKSVQTLWLSTTSTVFRLVLFLCLVPLLGALPSSIASVIVALLFVSIVSFFVISRTKDRGYGKPFTQKSTLVIFNTIIFAWLTNSDVIFFKNLTIPQTASDYSVASMFIKAALVIPGTISIFLLPKLARDKSGNKGSLSSFNRSSYITFVSAIGISLFLLIAGGNVIGLLFGKSYSLTNQFVFLVSISFIPWIMAQNELMRTNTNAFKKETLFLVLFAVMQAILFIWLLPNVVAAIAANFIVGLLAFCTQRFVALSVRQKN